MIILVLFYIFIGYLACESLLYIYNKICYNILEMGILFGNERVQKIISKILGA